MCPECWQVFKTCRLTRTGAGWLGALGGANGKNSREVSLLGVVTVHPHWMCGLHPAGEVRAGGKGSGGGWNLDLRFWMGVKAHHSSSSHVPRLQRTTSPPPFPATLTQGEIQPQSHWTFPGWRWNAEVAAPGLQAPYPRAHPALCTEGRWRGQPCLSRSRSAGWPGAKLGAATRCHSDVNEVSLIRV